jgi:hypothetical protein
MAMLFRKCTFVEINRVRIEILNSLSYKSDCLKSKEREKEANIYGKEEGILGEAEYHIRRLMPSITAGARPTLQHGVWWRPMGAASHRAKSRANNFNLNTLAFSLLNYKMNECFWIKSRALLTLTSL